MELIPQPQTCTKKVNGSTPSIERERERESWGKYKLVSRPWNIFMLYLCRVCQLSSDKWKGHWQSSTNKQ